MIALYFKRLNVKEKTVNSHKSRVGLVQGKDRRSNVYRALDLVRDDIVPKLRDQVMLKPNFLSSTNQLAS